MIPDVNQIQRTQSHTQWHFTDAPRGTSVEHYEGLTNSIGQEQKTEEGAKNAA